MPEHINIQAVHVFRLALPYKNKDAAVGAEETVHSIVISIDTDAGIVGWGSASFDTKTADEAYDVIRLKLAQALMDSPSAPINWFLEMIPRIVPGSHSARAAVDIALHDLWSKQVGAPLCSILGLLRDDIPTSISIGACDIEKTLELTTGYIEQGFNILNIHCTGNMDEDINRVQTVRRESGRTLTVRLSAGNKYSISDSKKIVDALAEDIEVFDMSATNNDIDDFVKLAAGTPILISLSGAANNAKTALELFQKGVPALNLKLMECGGLAEAIRICNIAEVLDRKIIIGCTEELPISMSAAAHLALSHPSIVHAALDGHLNLDQHAASNGLFISNGFVTVPDRPGLGIEIRKKYLRP